LAPTALLKYSDKIKKYGNKKSDDKERDSGDPVGGLNLSSPAAPSVVAATSGTTPTAVTAISRVGGGSGELPPTKKSKASKAIEKMKSKLHHVTDLKVTEYQQLNSNEPASNNNSNQVASNYMVSGIT